MTSLAYVSLWGTPIGVLSLEDGNPAARFQYTEAFREMHVEVSPLRMPITPAVYVFPELPHHTFHGLPGLVSDSLPDKFGSKVLATWLREQSKRIEDLSSLDRLCYVGKRGMGALEYKPALTEEVEKSERVSVEALSDLAQRILKQREDVRAEWVPGVSDYASILKVGSSAGGARAKALIGWNEKTNDVRSGQVSLPPGYGYWLIKFDGIDGNGDKEGDDAHGYGRIEYAYSLMARAAGIEMTDCRLWNNRHFMTKRFDRTPSGGKLHMQTLGALAHYDFNDPTASSYEDALFVTRRVVGSAAALEQLFRRIVFNVLAWNCDDHVKNISFLMDRSGEWCLAPAYDMCYAYNPAGAWTSQHQMSVNGKRIGITRDDFVACGRSADLKPTRVRTIVDEVRDVIGRWPEFASMAGVKESFAQEIGNRLANATVL